MDFEWDPEKDQQNQRRHQISFIEASSIFGDPMALTIADPDHSADEDRFLTTGYSNRGRLVIVAHTDRGLLSRIITARDVTPMERRNYEELK